LGKIINYTGTDYWGIGLAGLSPGLRLKKLQLQKRNTIFKKHLEPRASFGLNLPRTKNTPAEVELQSKQANKIGVINQETPSVYARTKGNQNITTSVEIESYGSYMNLCGNEKM